MGVKVSGLSTQHSHVPLPGKLSPLCLTECNMKTQKLVTPIGLHSLLANVTEMSE